MISRCWLTAVAAGRSTHRVSHLHPWRWAGGGGGCITHRHSYTAASICAASSLPTLSRHRQRLMQTYTQQQHCIVTRTSFSQSTLSLSPSAAVAPPVRSPLPDIPSNPVSKLVKIELSTLAACTSVFGFYLAGGSLFQLLSWQGVAMLTGTMGCAFTASIINQVIERKHDGKMQRTQSRPLVTGVITIPQASIAAIALTVSGSALLFSACGNHLSAPLIALTTIALYAGVYTPLKRYNRINTELGALVGALPVLVGAACHLPTAALLTASPSALSSVMLGFAFMTLWQMPHFMMINCTYADQYKEAGYYMRSSSEAPKHGMLYAVCLFCLPFLGFHSHVTTPAFLFTGTALTAYFVSHYYQFYRHPTQYKSRLFLYIYFVLMFGAICLHSTNNKDVDNITHELLMFIHTHIYPLPSSRLTLQGWTPTWFGDNAAFWSSLPPSIRAVCGKTYHDQMKAEHLFPHACPVVIINEGQEAILDKAKPETQQP